MTGHTPGPWEVGEITDGEGRPISYEAIIYGGDDDEAEIYVRGIRARDDARLIAAAPEMLEALKEARRQLELYEESATGETYNSPQINAAIAKAEGRS